MHGRVCPCPNCRGSGGWGWLLLVAAFAAAVIACCFAVHAALVWLAAHVLIDALAAGWLAFGGFGVAWKARERARRGLPNSARAMSQCAPGPRRAQGRPERVHVPEQRRGQ
jgi:hypothetical protein